MSKERFFDFPTKYQQGRLVFRAVKNEQSNEVFDVVKIGRTYRIYTYMSGNLVCIENFKSMREVALFFFEDKRGQIELDII